MGSQLHLDVGCFVAFEKPDMKNEARFPKTQPLAAGATMLGMRPGRPSHLWNPSDDLSLSGPDSDFPDVVSHEQPLRIQNSALGTRLSYNMRDQSHMRCARRDRFLNCSLYFFGPHFVGTFGYRCNLNHLYVFLTDRYIG